MKNKDDLEKNVYRIPTPIEMHEKYGMHISSDAMAVLELLSEKRNVETWISNR